MKGAGGAPRSADRAWLLARELASLMDEAERAGIDLARRLPDAAEPDFAEHWAKTLEFLHIVTAFWPAWLAENGVMNPAARQVALLEAQAAAWEDDPPGLSGADRRHDGGDTGGRAAAARGGAPAAGPGGAAATRYRHGRRSLGGAGTVACPGRAGASAGGPGCDARRCAGSGKAARRRRFRRRGSRCCPACCCRPPRCTTGWTARPVSLEGCRG